jgi:hypothetical protein
LRRNALNTPSQFGRCAAGESEKKNATRIRAVDDQMGDSMGESFGLAGTSAGDHEKGSSVIVGDADVVLYGLALLPIELAEIRGSVWHVESAPGLRFQHGSRFVPVSQWHGTDSSSPARSATTLSTVSGRGSPRLTWRSTRRIEWRYAAAFR